MDLKTADFQPKLLNDLVAIFKRHKVNPNQAISICAVLIGAQAENHGWSDESVIEQFTINLAIGRARYLKEEGKLS